MELPTGTALSELVRRHAQLLASFGEEIGERPLVLPNAEFFPDRFTGDGASARALVKRMLLHAGMTDIPVSVRILGREAPAEAAGCGTSGCSTGGCATPSVDAAGVPRLVDDGEQWILNIPEHELGAPVVLTTLAARALGHVFLRESAHESAPIAEPLEVTADLAASALGFGPVLLEGAYIYSKSCGGPNVAQVTRLTLPELAVVTALFCEVHDRPARAALKELGTSQRAALAEALSWAKSNRQLIERLRRDPSTVTDGAIKLEETRPWLLRVFGKKKAPEDMSLSDLEAMATSLPTAARPAAPRKRSAEDDELRHLVSEALTEAQSDAE